MTEEELRKIAEVEAVMDNWQGSRDGRDCIWCGPDGATVGRANSIATTFGKSDWLYCPKHKIAWNYGSNNFDWRGPGRFGQIASALELDGFDVVDISTGKRKGYAVDADVTIKFINEFWNGGDEDDDAVDLRADHGA